MIETTAERPAFATPALMLAVALAPVGRMKKRERRACSEGATRALVLARSPLTLARFGAGHSEDMAQALHLRCQACGSCPGV